jgi:predicted nucleotide-binding protein (sugar kinase/HSP70/actin superfamily)
LIAQFGEGWALPAEIVSLARNKADGVISLQPFGCIANHVISKGVENKIKQLFPNLTLLSLDFDSGVSPVNVENRLMMLIESIREQRK